MKKHNYKFTFLLIFLIGFLFVSGNNSINNSSAILLSEETSGPVLKALVTHGPINVEYDENFTDYGFPGIGTPGDPYRIENYNITVSGDYPILFGGNQSKHFVIQDCFLKTDTNIGIFLGKYQDMADGIVTILNNEIIAENNVGILMNGGKNSLISGNNISSYDDGIDIYDSAGFSTISYNIITTVDNSGIYLDNCPSTTITRNTCVGNRVGISLNAMDNAIVTHNNCSENEIGIEINSNSNNHTISNNILIYNTDRGIDPADTDNTKFTYNLLQKNTNYAIRFFAGSDNNILHHNVFDENNEGGVQASDDGANNIWYDTVSVEGNWWSDWVSGSYAIDGTAGALDLYPLNYIPEISEYSSTYLAFLMIMAFIAIPVVTIVHKRK